MRVAPSSPFFNTFGQKNSNRRVSDASILIHFVESHSANRQLGLVFTFMKQVGAIPYRRDEEGNAQVLLVTSRQTGRWVIPKGWRMKALADRKAASIEAKQEAGVSGRVRRKPVGIYEYFKRTTTAFELIEVTVFLLEVEVQSEEWPEMAERQRRWFSIEAAELLVGEPGLKAIFRTLSTAHG